MENHTFESECLSQSRDSEVLRIQEDFGRRIVEALEEDYSNHLKEIDG